MPQANLSQELDAVQGHLSQALQELRAPLGELVRAQLAETFSPLRTSLILAAGYGRPDPAQLQEQRVLLAAALEMLRLALHIHKLLLRQSGSAHEQDMDKSWIGSIILAGDYCFSRAASLAARTNQPHVVEIFAQALKSVSEGHLRRLFTAGKSTFPEEAELLDAGLTAATWLANLPATEQEQALAGGRALLDKQAVSLIDLPAHQRARWCEVQLHFAEGVGTL